MAADPGVQQVDEFGRHECVVIRDIQADHLLVLEMTPEASGELRAVTLLHDEDDVRPFDEFGRARVVSIEAESGRGNVQIRAACEDPLSGRATQAVAAAKEEDAAHEGR